MALAITPKPAYPTVPNASGVPPLLSQIGQAQNAVVLLAEDAMSVVSMFSTPQWGLFTTDGQPAFAATSSGVVSAVLSALGSGGQSVGELEYRQDHRISTAQQEQGSFLAYNKVATPYAGRVTYIIGGMEAQRGAFLTAVDALQASTTLLNLVMPEKTYTNCNITHHDVRRTARSGVTMFAVDIWVEEVRMTATTGYSNTAQPSGADATNTGTVQPQTPTLSQATTGRAAGPV